MRNRDEILTRIADELGGIRRVLESFVPDPPDPEPEGCQHPDDARKWLSMPGEPMEYVCGVCHVHVGGEVVTT